MKYKISWLFSSNLLFYTIIFLLIFIAYSNTFFVPFVFDDLACITGNRFILHPGNIRDIFFYWPTRFITYMSFAINYKIGGFNVTGYHIVNLLVHTGSSFLVFNIARKLLMHSFSPTLQKDINNICLFSAMIFALHPLQTQAVTYVYQRHTCLATFFILSSFLCWLNAVERKKNHYLWFILSFVLAVFSMFTKEISIVLPFLIFMHMIWFRKDFYSGKMWQVVLYMIFLFSIIPAILFFTHSINVSELHQVKSMQGSPEDVITRKDYFLTQGQAFLIYIKLLFLPLKQNIDYDVQISQSIFFPPETFAGFMLMFLLLLVCAVFLKKNRLLSFSIAFFIISIIPQSSVVPKPDLVVEHRMYLPLTGFAIFIPAFLYWISKRKQYVTIILTILICFYAVLTYQRNNIWREPLKLWNDAVSKSPNKARPYLNRGLAYASKGDFENAIKDYTKAIQINPWYVEAYNNRGIVYATMKLYDLALFDFNTAIKINPDYPVTYNNRGVLYSSMNRWEMALNDFKHALALKPYYVDALKNRGIAYLVQKNFSMAINDFSKAIEIHPRNGQLYHLRALAYLMDGNIQNALQDARHAKKLKCPLSPVIENLLRKYPE